MGRATSPSNDGALPSVQIHCFGSLSGSQGQDPTEGHGRYPVYGAGVTPQARYRSSSRGGEHLTGRVSPRTPPLPVRHETRPPLSPSLHPHDGPHPTWDFHRLLVKRGSPVLISSPRRQGVSGSLSLPTTSDEGRTRVRVYPDPPGSTVALIPLGRLLSHPGLPVSVTGGGLRPSREGNS